MPVSLSAFYSLRSSDHDFRLSDELSLSRFLNHSIAFELPAYLLLGHMFSTEYVATAVLMSDWGWSIFLDIIDAANPSYTSNTSRVTCGVPSRRGVRRARIINGPTDMELLLTFSEVVPRQPLIIFSPSVSTGKRGITHVRTPFRCFSDHADLHVDAGAYDDAGNTYV